MDRYKLERELIRDEGWRSKAYKCTAGHWTIGVGHKMHPGELVGVIRDIEWDSEKIFQTLAQDINLAIRGCEHVFVCSRFEALSDARQRALVNMCFQLGASGLMGFRKMVNAVYAGDWVRAHREALDSKWARSDSPARAQRVAQRLLEG